MSFVIDLTVHNSAVALSPRDCVLYFYNELCKSCNRMSPILEEVATRETPIFRVDVGLFPGLAERYSVQSVPLFLRVSSGVVTDSAKGWMSCIDLKTRLGLDL